MSTKDWWSLAVLVLIPLSIYGVLALVNFLTRPKPIVVWKPTFQCPYCGFTQADEPTDGMWFQFRFWSLPIV